jgi:SM-20-related protein
MMAGHVGKVDEVGSRPGERANARCPHLVFRNVLGPSTVAALLEYVAAREADFTLGRIKDRGVIGGKFDYTRRNCLLLWKLGDFKQPIESFVREIAAKAVIRLGLIESAVEPREFQITAYGDGGRFAAHRDTLDTLDRVRILSCVYYFATTPPRFSGGELRLYGLPTLSGRDTGVPPFVDILPETDTLVVFPSWLRHEVLPVQVPSGAWADQRFTINCWLHRMPPSACQTAGAHG